MSFFSFLPSVLPNSMLVLGLLALGCSAAPDVQQLPPQTLTDGPSDLQETPVVASSEGVSALDLVPPEDEEEDDSKAQTGALIAIGAQQQATPGSSTDMRARLLEASRRETERRRTARASVVVINDKNLAEMAEGGNVTVASPPPASRRLSRSSTADPDRPGSRSDLLERDVRHLSPQEQEEVYWRRRARQLRSEWRDAWESLPELEAEAAALRQQFYAEDDPFVRDSRVKPAWDRALDRLQSTRMAMTEYENKVQDLMEEGRRAGALPGWLREGKELEPPVQTQRPEIETTDTIEPPEYRRPPG